MRLVRFRNGGPARAGLVVGDEVADLGHATGDPGYVVELLAGGPDALAAVRAVASSSARFALGQIELLAPVPRPRKFLAIGLNYSEHAAEGGRDAPDFPIFFNKQTTCVTGPYDPIHVPRASAMVDFEGELGIVIGRRCRHVPAARAHEVIAGYLVVDDVSVRDWQQRSPTMTLGKSFDTHGPTGPWVVTADEIDDAQGLRLQTWVSGELMQDASTAQMIFTCAQQIEILSTVCTLEPGDLISTGTPAGVGVFRTPPRFLVPGDTVRIEVEGVGVVDNPVIAEPDDTARI